MADKHGTTDAAAVKEKECGDTWFTIRFKLRFFTGACKKRKNQDAAAMNDEFYKQPSERSFVKQKNNKTDW